MQNLIIVAGPTCSGKSALALRIAEATNGIVINADAMQTYAELRILTARPSPQDEAQTPHALYGTRPLATPCTAASWRDDALAVIANTLHTPILCGGTGLYLHALLHGIAPIPDPSPAARAEARALLATLGPAALHARLDPATAATLRPQDSQRIARAYEVLLATGIGLADWQSRPPAPTPPFRTCAFILLPDRTTLRAAIATRWAAMLAAGALAEIRALPPDLDPSLPGLRAHGVPELRAHLLGALTLEEAGAHCIQATGQYTKRQATWLRHHTLAPPNDTFTINARWTHSQQLCLPMRDMLARFLSHAD